MTTAINYVTKNQLVVSDCWLIYCIITFDFGFKNFYEVTIVKMYINPCLHYIWPISIYIYLILMALHGEKIVSNKMILHLSIYIQVYLQWNDKN
jgi:hypothetical protein